MNEIRIPPVVFFPAIPRGMLSNSKFKYLSYKFNFEIRIPLYFFSESNQQQNLTAAQQLDLCSVRVSVHVSAMFDKEFISRRKRFDRSLLF